MESLSEMYSEDIIWGLLTFFHVILLAQLIWHELRRVTFFVWWQIVQTPIFLIAHHHDLSSYDFWAHYRLVFILGRVGDIVLAYRVINETLCTDVELIALTLEWWLGSQAIVIAIASYYPQYWARLEMCSNIIYLISLMLWMRILARPDNDF